MIKGERMRGPIHGWKQSLLAKTSESLVCSCTVDQERIEQRQDFHYLYAKGGQGVKDLQGWWKGEELLLQWPAET